MSFLAKIFLELLCCGAAALEGVWAVHKCHDYKASNRESDLFFCFVSVVWFCCFVFLTLIIIIA